MSEAMNSDHKRLLISEASTDHPGGDVRLYMENNWGNSVRLIVHQIISRGTAKENQGADVSLLVFE